MRLDKWLVENGHSRSRTRARAMIESGLVRVDAKIATKAALEIDHQKVEIIDQLNYVSRAQIKLRGAFEHFNLDVNDKVCMDIGASTGGFTAELLERGARRVIAVDVGHDQLVARLKSDPRVWSIEGCDFRDLSLAETGPVDVITMDVSFISVKKLIPLTVPFFKGKRRIVLLFKPQFEGGGFRIKTSKDHDVLLRKMIAWLEEEGWFLQALCPSPITGGDGNIEYLMDIVDTGRPFRLAQHWTSSVFEQFKKRGKS